MGMEIDGKCMQIRRCVAKNRSLSLYFSKRMCRFAYELGICKYKRFCAKMGQNKKKYVYCLVYFMTYYAINNYNQFLLRTKA